jgi:hypothetical protein
MTHPSASASSAEPILGFGLVRSPIAPLQHEPRVSSMQVSQALFGHVVWHLEVRGEWHRVRTAHDEYEGWMHDGYVDLIEDDSVRAMQADPVAFYRDALGLDGGDARERAHHGLPRPSIGFDEEPRVSLGCTVRAGVRRLHLPLGAWVHADQELIDGEAVPLSEQAQRFPRDAEAVGRSARRWFDGTSYQWGGVTPWGADCSGFVQTVYGLHGVDLPRDAWQQALVGRDAADDVASSAPGNLLFFSDREDRRITHVGLALGDARMAHLGVGRGGWSIETLTDLDDPYVVRLRASFTGARRVL